MISPYKNQMICFFTHKIGPQFESFTRKNTSFLFCIRTCWLENLYVSINILFTLIHVYRPPADLPVKYHMYTLVLSFASQPATSVLINVSLLRTSRIVSEAMIRLDSAVTNKRKFIPKLPTFLVFFSHLTAFHRSQS